MSSPVKAGELGKWLAENAAIALTYLLLAIASLPNPHGGTPNVCLMWPGAGFALAAILIRGESRLVGVMLGSVAVALYGHYRFPSLLLQTAGVPLEAWVGATQMRRLVDFRHDLHRVQDVAGLIGFGALLSPVIGATLGALGIAFSTGVWANYDRLWTTWWIGDMMGILIVAPVLLSFFGHASPRQSRLSLGQAAVLVLGVGALSLLAFRGHEGAEHAIPPTVYLVYPAAIWAALKYGARGVSLATLVVAGVSIFRVGYGHSPLTDTNPAIASIISIWLFLGVLAASTLTLAAVAAERERAKNESLAARLQLEAFVQHTPAAVAMFDREMRYLVVSHRWVSDYRLQDHDLIGKSHYDVFPEIGEEWKNDHRRVLQGEIYRREQDMFLRHDGTVDWLRYELRPWRDIDGEVGGVVMFTEVITARKRAEDALRASEARFRNLVAKLPGAIYRSHYDRHRAIEACSPYIEDLTGYLPHELQNAAEGGFERVIHPDDRAAAWKSIEEQLSRGSHYIVEYRIVRKDGEERHILDKGNRSLSTTTPLCLDGILFDMTDRKLREAEHIKAVKLESIGLLAGGIAHDFNNILTEIGGNVELARMEAAASGVAGAGERFVPLLERAREACARATDLARQLLTFSKGGAPVKKVSCLADMVRETVSFVLHGSNCSSEISLPQDIWKVEVDEEQIGQVLQNLILNADQAMPGGGRLSIRMENVPAERIPSVSVQLRPVPHICLSVEDRGTGIDPQHLSRIFDPYFTTRPSRSGLGLSTALSIVHRHGGTILVESEKGYGSLFRVYLPAVPEAAPTPSSSAPSSREPSGQGRVLVMDDEDGIRRVLETLLRKLGYEVTLTAHGEEAIARFQDARRAGTPYDFVLLDLTIPGGMGGKEAVLRLREIDPALKAMVVSGYSDDPILADCRTYGFTTSLAKPFSFQGLRTAIGDLEGNDAPREALV